MVPNLILQSHQVSIEMEPSSKEVSPAFAIAAPAFSADGGDADRPPMDRNDGFMGGGGVDARARQTQMQAQALCSNNGLRTKEVVKMKNDFTHSGVP